MNFFDLCNLGARLSVLFDINCSVINTERPELKADIIRHPYGFDIVIPLITETGVCPVNKIYLTCTVYKQGIMSRLENRCDVRNTILQAQNDLMVEDEQRYTLALQPGYIERIKKVLKETKRGIKSLQSLSLRNESNKLEKWFDFIMPILWGYSDYEISFYNNLDRGKHMVATVSHDGIICHPYRNNTCVGILLIHMDDSYSANRGALRRLVIAVLDRLECDDNFTVSVIYKNEPFDLSVVYKDMLETVHNLDDYYSSWQSLGNREKYKRIL